MFNTDLKDFVLAALDFDQIEHQKSVNGQEYMTTRQQTISLEGYELPDGRKCDGRSKVSICVNLWPATTGAVKQSKSAKQLTKIESGLTDAEKLAKAQEWVAQFSPKQ